MERLKNEIYHEIKLVNGRAFLEIAERAVKEHAKNPNQTDYSLDDFNTFAREAAEREDLFTLDKEYSDRYNRLRYKLGEIIEKEEQRAQKRVQSQPNPGLLAKILASLNPFKQQGFKGVAI